MPSQLFEITLIHFVYLDLKRNDYTPDKIIFPQDDSPELTIQPGSCTKESDSANSIRLML